MKAAAVGALPVVSMGSFVTLAIYSGNSSEFSASFFDLQIAFLLTMLLLIGVLGVVSLAMTKSGFRRYLAVLCAVSTLIWLQSNILVWDYGVLDGRPISWSENFWRGIVDLALWSVVLFVAITAFARFGKMLMITAVATFCIQIVSSSILLFDMPARDLFDSTVETFSDGKDAMPRFSKAKNIVHIVMDGFQADVFAEIVAETSTFDFQRELHGFTFFEHNLGAYPLTQLSVPALVSSKFYRNEVPVDQFVANTMRGTTILNAAFDAGYEIDIAAQVSLAKVYGLGNHNNSYAITSTEHVTPADYILVDSAKLIDLALFRSVPHFVKPLVHRDELWVFQGIVRSEAYLQMQYFSDLAFLSSLAEQMSADRDVPVYKMFHLMLSHRPTVGNEQCEFDGQNPTERKFVKMQARCGLTKVVAVLRRMKELNIYDNSLIVLMADHGAWIDVELQTDASTKRIRIGSASDALRIAMATPMLAIKPPNARHDFAASDAQTSIIDVPATIAEIGGIDGEFDGMPVMSIKGGEPRVRYHLTYPWMINAKSVGYLLPIQEYRVVGNPYDTNAWHASKKFLPAAATD